MLGQGTSNVAYGAQNLQGLFQTPAVLPQTTATQFVMDVQYVNDKQSATNYQMMSNRSAVLFDKNKDVFYFKQTDATGAYTLDEYEFHKVEEEPIEEKYATKEEVSNILDKLTKIEQSLNKQTKTKNIVK